jgi:hypothetical protein
MRAFLALILLASPCAAQQAYSWGQSFAHIKAVGEGAVVTIGNRLTVWPDRFVLFGLDHGGIAVTVEVDQGPGDVPDVVIVHPPAGFVAVPPRVVMDEGTDAVIRIDPIPMG